MRKFFTLLLVCSALMAQAKDYTLAQLASLVGTVENVYTSGEQTIRGTVGISVAGGKYIITLPTGFAGETTGLTFDDGNIILSKNYLTVNGNIVMSAGDSLLFDKKAQIEINGKLTADKAYFGAAEGAETGTNGAKGIRMYKEGISATLTDCTFDYVNINYGNGTENGCLTIKNSTFNKHNSKGGNAVINFTSLSKGNLVEGCTFNDPDLSAIASGANVPCGITIKNNIINKSLASTRLYPGINMSATGPYDIVIEGNEVHGPAAVTRAGGIALACLLGNPPTGTLYVRNNFVENCSYGITLTGPGSVVMEGNTVKNNKYISSPTLGGSGLNITCNSKEVIAKAYMRGNHIEGNLWGITVIGNVDINAGKTADATAADYNPGENVFVNNGNGEPFVQYDFYNNTPNTSYAQGNKWSVETQDAESIAKVVFDKADDSSLGELIYTPAYTRKEYYTLSDLLMLVGTINNAYTSGEQTITENVGVSLAGGKYIITLPTGLASGVSGISFDDGNIILSKNYLTVNGNIVMSEGDSLLFDKKAQIEINGNLTADKAYFGAAEGAETGTNGAKGIRMYKEGISATLTDCTFDYVNINYGNGTENGCLTIKNSTFNKHNSKGGNAVINFTSLSKGNLVEGCTFNDPDLSAIASGANVPCGITIKNNIINKSLASTRLYPGINMSATGPYDIVIEGNEVHGPAAVTRAGGIALACLLGNPPTGTLYVRNNFVENCSYGITLTGPGSVVMEGNTVKNNKYISSPTLGGSGLNITCNSKEVIAKAYMRGNHIEGNLWGITVIGNVDINAGKTADATAADYNPGENVFVNNGNGEPFVQYDFYNNTPNTSYAQGNKWSVDEQISEKIENVVYHKADDSSLGMVIYMPAYTPTGINGVKTDGTHSAHRYNLQGQRVDDSYRGIVISNGKKVMKR